MATYHKRWGTMDKEIEVIESFKELTSGTAIINGHKIGVELDILNAVLIFRFGNIIDNTLNKKYKFTFNSATKNLKVSGNSTAHINTVKVKEGWTSRYTEGQVDEIKSTKWRNSDGRFRSYYLASGNKVLYHIFENYNLIELIIDTHLIYLSQEKLYVIIESSNLISLSVFSKISYSILVAFGFISGEFIQQEVFTFRKAIRKNEPHPSFTYRTLRKGGSSIYQAVIWNPYGYEHYTGHSIAKKLYREKTLKPLDIVSFTELIHQALHNSQIQYALVLFIDANESTQSLLIRNNCFFIVLEVLRKIFFDRVKDSLPKIYFQNGNIEKFKMVFEIIAPISKGEAATLEKRNLFLHGDIKNIEDNEMMEIMVKQIALIHKLIMTFIGYKGHIIDHYQLRYGSPKNAYIKLN